MSTDQAYTLESEDGRATLTCDMTEMEPAAWSVLADLLPGSAAAPCRAAVKGRTTGAPAVLISRGMGARHKAVTFAPPTCPTLAGIFDDWGLAVEEASTSSLDGLDVCCVEVGGMDEALARENVRAAAAAIRPSGWLLVRGAAGEVIAPALGDFRAAMLDPPYANRLSVCHRDPDHLQRFGGLLTRLLSSA